MKKILLLLLLGMSITALSQPLTVSTESHTVPDLVNNVLINSPCVSATNVTWSTGTNFGSTNGIGYFQTTNPAFPLTSGVVLSTGNALNVPGPNTSMLNDGNEAWPGDSDLEATLLQAGIPMNSVNATVLEFDFTPISSQFSFDFVFASEEYGNYQCQFSDAFAFLLTNVNTGQTVNLAVVPGSNAPISVVTIRDFLYNSSCPSVNSQYFGAFNGGANADASATNFNGQTVVMNASAVLTPNTPYHIKLVIADRTDHESDSAIFLASESFNIGQDVLGPDVTPANGVSLCPGTPYTIESGLIGSQYTFEWKRNGVVLPGETASSLVVTDSGNYTLTYNDTSDPCPPVADSILVTYLSALSIPNPNNLLRCNNGQPTYEYNLALNTPVVSAGINPAPVVTYHASQTNADNNLSPLPTLYTAAPGTTIYVRIQNNAGCHVVKSFVLGTTMAPVAHAVSDLTACQHPGSTMGIFNLGLQTADILNGQIGSNVTYHASLSAAQGGTAPLNANGFIGADGAVVYARVNNLSDPTTCYAITSFTLHVKPLPPVDDLEDVVVCDQYVLFPLTDGNYFTGPNGTGTPKFAGDIITETTTLYIFNEGVGEPACPSQSNFKVTIIEPGELSPEDISSCSQYVLPTMQYGEYRTQAGGAGEVIPAGTVLTETTPVHYFFQTTIEPVCTVDTVFNVTILPGVEVGTFANIFNCGSYELPALAVGNYYTQPNGGGTQLPAGSVITSNQRIYVYAETTSEPACTDEANFFVQVVFTPPVDVVQCEPYILPNLPNNGKYFTGPNGTGTIIAQGTPITGHQQLYLHIIGVDCTLDIPFEVTVQQPPVDTLPHQFRCEPYVLPELTHGNYFTGPNGTGIQLHAGDEIDSLRQIFIYNVGEGGCGHQSAFTVYFLPKVPVDSRGTVQSCNGYTLTPLENGNYFTGPNGTGTPLFAGDVINETQTVYIYATPTGPNTCAAESHFLVDVYPLQADLLAPVDVCDSYTLQPLVSGDYFTMPGGPHTAGNVMRHAGEVLTSSIQLFIYVESGERINCWDEKTFDVTITPTPVVAAVAPVKVCDSYTLPALVVGNYYTGPNKTGDLLNAGDVLTTTQLVYMYAETNQCFDEKVLDLTIFNVPDYADVVTCSSYALPALTGARYYSEPNAGGIQFTPGSLITTSRTIYIYAQSPFTPMCFDESSFDVTVVPQPVAFPVSASLTTVCDEDGTNDGIFSFDLTTLNATLLGAQTGSQFTVTYYNSLADAEAGINALTESTSAQVFAKVTNTLAPDCAAIRPLNITVHKLPVATAQDGYICFDEETGTLLNPYVIHSGISASTHTIEWYDPNGDLVGTGSSYTAASVGEYTILATSHATGCTSETVINVGKSEPAELSYSVSESFTDNADLIVHAVGTGNYEYSIDGGPWTSNPVFAGMGSGMHVILARDLNGCENATINAMLVNYPKYFTPNGDGIHDTWNITDLYQQENSLIQIFDRYGKFISEIRPAGSGWDGTLNGQNLPSTDYWFVVNFKENGAEKEFRAHFSLKR